MHHHLSLTHEFFDKTAAATAAQPLHRPAIHQSPESIREKRKPRTYATTGGVRLRLPPGQRMMVELSGWLVALKKMGSR
jgi:hypothetical protein